VSDGPVSLSQFFATCPGLLFVADQEGALLHRSELLGERFGHRLEDASLASLVAAEDREAVEALLGELAETEEAVSRVFRIPERDGEHTRLRCVARRSPAGSIHGQLEPVESSPSTPEARIEHLLFRAMLNTLEVALWAVDRTGKFVFQDGKSLASVGLEPGQFVGANIFELYPPEVTDSVEVALAGESSYCDTEVHDLHWKNWHIPLKNEAGETEYSAALSLDVTTTVRTQHELERQLDTIRRQQQAIHELSAPLLEVWDGVLTVPLIGVMDSTRTAELSERLLTAVSRSNARFAILDLTGVETLDTSIANHILRLLGSLRLLGTEGIITGISPRVAQTITGLGIDLQGISTRRSLRDGLRYCMRRLRQSRR
jgi:rsbT co-antagonist protein RsbR